MAHHAPEVLTVSKRSSTKAAEQALSLDTSTRHTVPVRIDGADYRMRMPQDLTTAELRILQGLHVKVQSDGNGATEALEQMRDMILRDVPEDVRGRLNVGHIAALAQHFLSLKELSFSK